MDNTIDRIVTPLQKALAAKGEKLIVNLNYVAFTSQITTGALHSQQSGGVRGVRPGDLSAPEREIRLGARPVGGPAGAGQRVAVERQAARPGHRGGGRPAEAGRFRAGVRRAFQHEHGQCRHVVRPDDRRPGRPAGPAGVLLSSLRRRLAREPPGDCRPGEAARPRHRHARMVEQQQRLRHAARRSQDRQQLRLGARRPGRRPELRLCRSTRSTLRIPRIPASRSATRRSSCGNTTNSSGPGPCGSKPRHNWPPSIPWRSSTPTAITPSSSSAPPAGEFSLGGLPTGIYGIKYTTAGAYDVDLPDQTISSGQAVTAAMPQPGVLTVYGKPALPDKQPPSAPANLAAQETTPGQITLTWDPSTDDVAVAGYKIYRDGVRIGFSPTPAFDDANVEPGTSYTYEVSAYDTAGNESPRSTRSLVVAVSEPHPDPDLLGHWKFDDGLRTDAVDSSAYGRSRQDLRHRLGAGKDRAGGWRSMGSTTTCRFRRTRASTTCRPSRSPPGSTPRRTSTGTFSTRATATSACTPRASTGPWTAAFATAARTPMPRAPTTRSC